MPGCRFTLVNALAAVVRCSGARVLRTPSHVKEGFTAAVVVRSLWAALRSRCVAGCWASRCRPGGEVCRPVSWNVVVAMDMSEIVPVLICARGPGAGLTLALAADSSQPVADSALDLPIFVPLWVFVASGRAMLPYNGPQKCGFLIATL